MDLEKFLIEYGFSNEQIKTLIKKRTLKTMHGAYKLDKNNKLTLKRY
jgi:virulence-associated protein VapD